MVQAFSLSPPSRIRSSTTRLLAAASSKTKKASSKKATTTKRKASKKSKGGKKLVIVESPRKSETLSQLLQQLPTTSTDYEVLACVGHVRDLRKKKKKKPNGTATKKETDFPYEIAGIDLSSTNRYEPDYEILDHQRDRVRQLKKAARDATTIVLATDPDREGEAMAWHLQQVLSSSPMAGPRNYERWRLKEFTLAAVQEAVEQAPVEQSSTSSSLSNKAESVLDMCLVRAQETRRCLDRLFGFTVSPVLWKVLAVPGLSAGRVQSVGMALVVERERERLRFVSTPYFSLHGNFSTTGSSSSGALFPATLHSIHGRPMASSGKDFVTSGSYSSLSPLSVDSAKAVPESVKFHLCSETVANEWLDRIYHDGSTTTDWTVVQVNQRQRQQSAPAPYRTSTLQQDGNRRLGLSVSETMRTAQLLYEQGYISYMRTDSTRLSEAAEAAMDLALERQKLSVGPRKRAGKKKKEKSSSKFAQEAHEAIRPSLQDDGTILSPDEISSSLSGQPAALNLYRLIFQRSLASRMPPLVTNQTQVLIEGTFMERINGSGEAVPITIHFQASGSVVVSPGYT